MRRTRSEAGVPLLSVYKKPSGVAAYDRHASGRLSRASSCICILKMSKRRSFGHLVVSLEKLPSINNNPFGQPLCLLKINQVSLVGLFVPLVFSLTLD